jgi:23S rRNA (cytidine1920-2'-O)/16S rRNA (cytidine1409-2'-O)-methyltransferase
VGKRGIVRSEAAREKAVTKIWAFLEEESWRVLGVIPSPILGRGGNAEFLIGARHGE